MTARVVVLLNIAPSLPAHANVQAARSARASTRTATTIVASLEPRARPAGLQDAMQVEAVYTDTSMPVTSLHRRQSERFSHDQTFGVVLATAPNLGPGNATASAFSAAPYPANNGLPTGTFAETSFSPAPGGRLSGSAWVLARGGGDAVIAGNGLFGGSQAGGRMLFRVNGDVSRPFSLSGRVSAPLRRQGAQAAVGVEWQPVAGIPIRVLAERRQRLTEEARSAFALLVHGGVGDLAVGAGLRLDSYAQAGIVGARRRDLFADGGVTLVRSLGGGEGDGWAVGAGAWGGVQPGAARLDIGPRVTNTLGSLGRGTRVSLDWRFRVAGHAAPASGPSLTIGTDF